MDRRDRDLWIINGMPGSGKTTIARLLAERLEQSAHISGDYVHDMVVGGHLEPDAEPFDEAMRQVELADRNQCGLALSFLKAGFTPVLDYVIHSKARLDTYHAMLPGCALHLVNLAPGLESTLRRKTFAAQRWEVLEAMIRSELSGIGLWLDSSGQTPEQTLEAVLAGKADARLG